MVAIGEMRIVGADELFARHGAKRVEDALFADPAALQLPLDHRLALGGEVCHGFGHGPTSAGITREAMGAFR